MLDLLYTWILFHISNAQLTLNVKHEKKRKKKKRKGNHDKLVYLWYYTNVDLMNPCLGELVPLAKEKIYLLNPFSNGKHATHLLFVKNLIWYLFFFFCDYDTCFLLLLFLCKIDELIIILFMIWYDMKIK